MSAAVKEGGGAVVKVRFEQPLLARLQENHKRYVLAQRGGNRAILRQCDLSGLDFRGMDFTDAEMIACNFAGADLRGATFVRANIFTANFDNANLSGADFERADLRGARFE